LSKKIASPCAGGTWNHPDVRAASYLRQRGRRDRRSVVSFPQRRLRRFARCSAVPKRQEHVTRQLPALKV